MILVGASQDKGKPAKSEDPTEHPPMIEREPRADRLFRGISASLRSEMRAPKEVSLALEKSCRAAPVQESTQSQQSLSWCQ